MPRAPRLELEGGIHHVTARGNRRHDIFRDDDDRHRLLSELRVAARVHRWTCLSYCLMRNHLHLVIETRERTLGMGMRQLAGTYAQHFNRRHNTVGHLFQGRYGSVLVRTDAQFAQLLRYVALNPVKAGLCSSPEAWRWSSHRALVSRMPSVTISGDRVDALLEVWGGRPGRRYARLFEDGCPVAAEYGDESPWTQRRPSLTSLLERRPLDDALRAAHAHGYRLAEIGAAVGLHPSTVSRRTRRAT